MFASVSTGELMQVELVHPVALGREGFMVRVLGDCGEMWEAAEDISDAAVLVATSTWLCSAMRPNTVYYAMARVWAYSLPGASRSWRCS